MTQTKAVAIVGLGAVLPDAPDVATFWKNIQDGRNSIRDVPPNRWRVDLFYDPDPNAVDKTYSKIGAWVTSVDFNPLKWGIPIPLPVLTRMDDAQKWAIAASRQALMDYGYPEKRSFEPDRVAVILGNALAGEYHYRTSLRINMPIYIDSLTSQPAFQALPADLQAELVRGMHEKIHAQIPQISEDTMPGELSSIIAGRVANVFNFGGANFTTDAACASSLAAIQAAVDGLNTYQFDAVLSGGIDRSMGSESFVKFSKIGALSPDGSRPYSDGANGFVMGEGGAVFLLKRLVDAERDGDRIYGVIRGLGSSSDGKGKGITAPNPIGQQRALERAWKNAGVNPASAGLIEGHGTSTRVGDVVEVSSLDRVFGGFGLPAHTIALGSVKSNIGHLKAASGAAGLLKTVLGLYHKVLPPSINFSKANPNIDFEHLPFFVNTLAQPWERREGEIRRAGVSSFGFGGTNFHLVVEEHVPGLLTSDEKVFTGVELKAAAVPAEAAIPAVEPVMAAAVAVPTLTIPVPAAHVILPAGHGRVFLSAATPADLKQRLAETVDQARQGMVPLTVRPNNADVRQTERIAIDYESIEELIKRGDKALKAFDNTTTNVWPALTAQGIYRGHGQPGKVVFLFPGQGSQYANMLRDLSQHEPVIVDMFAEADRVMTPLLGRSMTSYIFSDPDEASVAKAEAALKDTAITQPAMLTADIGMLRLMKQYGYGPDLVIGHSLGEYGALVAAGVFTFAEALEIVSARGRGMTELSMDDNGAMAAVSAPIAEVERILKSIDGYVVIANINSPLQSVIAGETKAVDAAIAAFMAVNYQAVRISVSHAFHSRIVAAASVPLRRTMARMNIRAPRLPVIANVTAEQYPTGREEIIDMLAAQVASPVQFIRSVEKLYAEGGRVFVESGPKRVLSALVTDILKDKHDITLIATNHPRKGGLTSFSEALCGLFAAGVESEIQAVEETARPIEIASPYTVQAVLPAEVQAVVSPAVIEAVVPATPVRTVQVNRANADYTQPLGGSVVISGAGLGLPGKNGNVFAEDNVQRILSGEMRIEAMPENTRRRMLAKRVTRLVKSEAGALMVEIKDLDLTIKLGGQRGAFDLESEFGVPLDRVEATDISTQLAIAAGIEALRDAGIPLVMTYRQTSKGTYLPNRWMLPESMQDETGVIFGSAFPGMERMADEAARYYEFDHLSRQRDEYLQLLAQVNGSDSSLRTALERRLAETEAKLAEMDYHFDRRFIFRILAMGHSQFAEYIGARGPNTHVNAACATTTQAIGVAEDWIRTGRCRRVVVISGDDVTDGSLVSWVGTGLLASGATTTEGDLRQAALPFDRRRNGMIMGMGAAALVIESEDAVRERGMRGICEILASQIANSAYHGTRLDVSHVSQVMERLMTQAEQRCGIDRSEIAAQTVFVSHETYTPARGGSAAAEIKALRQTFGEHANQVIIANTKGYTGHTMGVGIEDVVAVKALEYGIVPPIAHLDEHFEPDPDLGDLNLSRGGAYPVRYSLRLGAGFGSQVAMTLLRQVAMVGERVNQPLYRRWLASVSGYAEPELEVVQHTLRIHNQGQPVVAPSKTQWQFGQGPSVFAREEDRQRVMGQQVTSHQGTMASAEGSTPGGAFQGEAVLTTTSVGNSVASPALAPAPALTPETVPAPFDEEALKHYIVGVVAEKTGYPAEMLDMDLDLEADLGVDTVKQAELFATLREHYGIPRREDLRLSDYNTLAKVFGFFKEILEKGQAPGNGAPGQQGTTPAMGRGEAIHTTMPTENSVASPSLTPTQTPAPAAAPARVTVNQASFNSPVTQVVRVSQFITAASETNPVPVAAATSAAPLAATSAKPAAIPTAAIATPVVAPVAAPTAIDEEEIKQRILALVSEKTGYPQEMLDLDLDLEADLGVDTVKQAELFASMREAYHVARREDLRLSDYNTLAKVIGFFKEILEERERGTRQQVTGQQGTPPDMGRGEAIRATTTTENSVASPALDLAPAAPSAVPTATPITPVVVPVAAPTVVNEEEIKQRILALVSEKTGYPQEMLDLDLDLEADLGVDTVKQAELFASMRDAYHVARREDLRLSDYNTLAKVIEFFREILEERKRATPKDRGQAGNEAPGQQETQPILGRGEALRTTTSTENSVASPFLAPTEDSVAPAATLAPDITPALTPAATLAPDITSATTPAPDLSPEAKPAAALSSIPRRVPVGVLRPRLDLCLPTSVTLGEGSRVIIVNDRAQLGDTLLRHLRERGVEVFILQPSDYHSAAEQAAAIAANGPVQGVYFLPALDVEPALSAMSTAAWQQGLEDRVDTLYHLLRALPGEPFLVCATRCGGLHGYTAAGASAPMGGAVSGFAKALSWERPNSLVKVVDFQNEATSYSIATHLVQETLFDPAVAEVGWEGEQRYAISLFEQPSAPTQDLELDASSVFLVSGGTGGITAPIVLDLAQRTHARFYLLGRSPLPERNDPDLLLLKNDRDGLRKELMRRLALSEQKPSPAHMEARLAALERAAAALDTIDAVRQSGARVAYLIADITDPESAALAVETVLKAEGKVDVLIHAAGIERSRKFESKPLEEFKQTIAVKAGGFFYLFKALEQAGSLPRAVAAFSSVAGRFGNSGQTDYSAANDLLCRLISAMRNQYPAIKSLVLDWGAWAEVGMASRGHIPELMRRAGIEMLQPAEAAPLVYRELTGGHGEIVLAGALGALEQARSENSGLDLEKANAALTAGRPAHIMFSRVTGLDLKDGVILEADLDPNTQPFLKDHALNGTPLLPGVMGIEGFSVAAQHIASVLASEKSGFRVAGLEDIQFLAPFKFYRSEPRRITWKAQVARADDGLIAHVTLESTLALRSRPAEHMLHFSGKVHLQPQETQVSEQTVLPPKWNGSYTVGSDDIYKLYFHGPAFQVLEGVQRSGTILLGKLSTHLPPMTEGEFTPLSTPILVELCLQTAGVWEAGTSGVLSLPRSIGSLTLYRTRTNGAAIFAEVQPVFEADGALHFNARVIDAKGRLYLELCEYRTVPLPYSVEQNLLEPFMPLVKE